VKSFTLENSIGFIINRAALKLKHELQRSFRSHGYDITAEQFAVLMCLREKEAQTQTEIAEKVVKDKTNLTRILDGMEKKELIIRSPHEDDRRSYRILLTRNGQELIERLVPLAIQVNVTSIQCLNEQDKQEIKRIANLIYNNL
jgi:DNA-binding MarR family transcriptional regulator